MKNYDNNQDDDIDEQETMSFSDFFLTLSIKVILGFFLCLYVFAMAIVLLYLKLSK
jgi:hypothetical protein